MKKAVCILSGGMDSTLCAYKAKFEGYEIIALHFDYNQRTMEREREAFFQICDELKVAKKVVLNVDFICKIGGNSLTDRNLEIRKSGLDDEIPNTYVPYRNGIFLSIAAALAQKEGASVIFIGVVEEDSSGYPDCSNEFIKSIENSINLGTKANPEISIKRPLVNLTKAQIVKESLELGVKLELTWSCYQNNKKACGVCDSCRLRLAGFKKLNLEDKIEYETL